MQQVPSRSTPRATCPAAPLRAPARRRLAATTLALALASALAPAAAATTGDAAAAADAADHAHGVTDLDAIQVRANPIARSAEDLARPVAVLAGEALDAAKAGTIGETTARLPGVQSSYFGAGVGRPIIRGLDGARVQVLSDGLAAGDVSTVSVDHAVSIEPFLANQVEVLKGPASLLYGNGAIGGAVNVVDGRIPEAPTGLPLEGRAELRAGSVNDETTGMLRLDGTSASGRLVFHVDALHREAGDVSIPGHADSDALHGDGHAGEDLPRGVLPNSFVRTDSGAIGVSWVGDRGFLGAARSLYASRYGLPGHSHGAEAGHDDPGHDEGHDHHGDDHGDVHVDLDQRRTEVRGGLDGGGAVRGLRVRLAHTAYTHTEYEGREVGTVFDNDAVEGRVELVHQPLAGWEGAFGLQASRRDFAAAGEEAFVPDSESRDLGAFWIGERDFGALGLELGLRHDRNRIEAGGGAGSRRFHTTSASLAARWDLSPDLHLLLGLDRAQRSPTAEELHSGGLHVATRSWEFGDAALGVETANRAELGLHWHVGPLRLGAALYHLRYADFIHLADTGIVEDGLPVRAWIQSDARFDGGELEAEWTFEDARGGAWTVRAFGDVVRARLDGRGTRTVAVEVPHGDHVHAHEAEVALSGPLPRIAPARLGAELRWAGGPWRAALGAVRHARQDRVAAHESQTPGYTLVHADLAWHRDTARGGAVEVFVDGRNLLDEEARVHTSFLKDVAPLPGRGVSAGVRVMF